MSSLVDIAIAVVDTLNAGMLPAGTVAERAYRPMFELTDLKSLHVTVVPKASMAEIVGRIQSQREVQIDVAIQKRVRPEILADSDEIDLLCEEIADGFLGQILMQDENELATCTASAREPIYDPEHMDQKRVFTGVATLTFLQFS